MASSDVGQVPVGDGRGHQVQAVTVGPLQGGVTARQPIRPFRLARLIAQHDTSPAHPGSKATAMSAGTKTT